MSSYLTLDTFKSLSVMPTEAIDQVERKAPGWIDSQLEYWSSFVDARLAKRYAVPFTSPYPVAVLGWLTRIVTMQCYLRRGVDADDLQFQEIKASADEARADLKEAADSEVGLFDLPLRADTTVTGVSKGGPFGYSEQSPYVRQDIQAATARNEDMNGSGSYG